MTIKLYRKAFAGITLAVSLLLTGVVPRVEANTGILSSADLLGTNTSISSADQLTGNASDAVTESVHGSVTSQVDPIAGFSRPASVANTILAQNGTEFAQDGVNPVDNTFAPLTDEELRQQLLINPDFVPGAPRPSPASGFGVPSAFGADWGDAFIGIAGVTEGRTDDKADGSISLGAGFGNADDNVGVVTQLFELQPEQSNTLPLTASLGVGTGAFRSIGAIDAGTNDPNVFGSLGLQVIPELSIISGWTGNSLGLGLSTAPFDFPLVITAGVSDVTDNTRSGTRVNASVGYSFSF